MFAKLLKYEWKATAGLLGMLSLAALSCGTVGGFILRFMLGHLEPEMEHDPALAAIMMPMSLLLVFLILALVIYMVAVQFLLLRRFYKNKFTDEGYLTFTLPASSHEIFLSSLANMLLWSLLSGIVLGVSILVMFLIGMWGIEGLGMDMGTVYDAYSEEFAALMKLPGYATYRFISWLGGVASWFCGPVQMMSCVTVGAVWAKKHKILTAVGIYYFLNVIVSTILGSLSSIIAMNEYNNLDVLYGTGSLTVQGIQILLTSCLAVGGYFLSVHLMNKKLNLA